MKKTIVAVFLFFVAINMSFAQEGKYVKVKNKDCLYYSTSNGWKYEWKGKCKNGYLNGEGSLNVYDSDGELDYTYKGGMIMGKENGECKLYEDGILHTIGNYKNGIETGEWKAYYKSGKLHTIGNYKNGIETGEWKAYYENGKLQAEGKYENGEQSGEWRVYYESGKLQAIVSYEKGKENGEGKSFYENGKIQKEIKYKNGIRVGAVKEYDENGNLIGTK